MTWIVLAAAAVVTSALSGALGMAGGVLLMTLCSALLPVPAAMVAHGATQIASNGSRWIVLRASADVRGVGLFALGAAAAGTASVAVGLRLGPGPVHLALGAVALAASALRGRALPGWESRGGPVVCGVLVTLTQIAAGVAGPLLDAFFVRSEAPRHRVVATKAATQVVSHALKIAVWGAALDAATAPPAAAILGCIAAAVAGTLVGTRLLDRWSDEGFRRATRTVIAVLGVVHVAWGLSL